MYIARAGPERPVLMIALTTYPWHVPTQRYLSNEFHKK